MLGDNQPEPKHRRARARKSGQSNKLIKLLLKTSSPKITWIFYSLVCFIFDHSPLYNCSKCFKREYQLCQVVDKVMMHLLHAHSLFSISACEGHQNLSYYCSIAYWLHQLGVGNCPRAIVYKSCLWCVFLSYNSSLSTAGTPSLHV